MSTMSLFRMPKGQRTERGQALVLIVLAIVGLLGFAALAVDLGRVYAERRRAQNAADSASMAWAYAASQVELGGMYDQMDVDGATPAFSTLLQNDFKDTPDRVSIEVYNPPNSGPYGPMNITLTEDERKEYYQVIIHTRVDQIFSQFIFSGSENITVEAVAHMLPFRSVAPGMALVATKQDTCHGVILNGDIETYITGGGVFSNSESDTNGTCNSGILTGGSGEIHVTDGDIQVHGGFSPDPNTIDPIKVSPKPSENVDPIDFPVVPVPYCDGMPLKTESDSQSDYLTPGIYTSPNPTAANPKPAIEIKSDVTMEAGMYCLDGDFKISSGSLYGDGVLIVMRKGSFTVSGNTSVYLKRPNEIEDMKGRNYNGMLIYMPVSNEGGIDLSGTSGSTYFGTIYAPGPRDPESSEKCQIGGNATGGAGDLILNLSAQIICSNVRLHGNPKLNIYYQEEQNYRMEPTVELAQ